MAKTAKLKHDPKSNPRSRAAKRATSPSIDIDRSIKDVPRASDVAPVLSARPNSGISKAKRKQKPMTRGQRMRQEKGLARAEAVQEQLVKKFHVVDARLKKRQARKALWDEINRVGNKEERQKVILGDRTGETNREGGEDKAMEETNSHQTGVDAMEARGRQELTAANKLVVIDRTAAATAWVVEEDEAYKIT